MNCKGVGCGSTFGIVLPLTAEDELPALSRSASPPVAVRPSTGGKVVESEVRALVVDDSSMLLSILKRQLSRFGLDVDTAESGPTACAMIDAAFESER